jgi:hypothetical protein
MTTFPSDPPPFDSAPIDIDLSVRFLRLVTEIAFRWQIEKFPAAPRKGRPARETVIEFKDDSFLVKRTEGKSSQPFTKAPSWQAAIPRPLSLNSHYS